MHELAGNILLIISTMGLDEAKWTYFPIEYYLICYNTTILFQKRLYPSRNTGVPSLQWRDTDSGNFEALAVRYTGFVLHMAVVRVVEL